SSRRRHTRSKRDWSSDVCSSDLRGRQECLAQRTCTGSVRRGSQAHPRRGDRPRQSENSDEINPIWVKIKFYRRKINELSGSKTRSEERRVGKEREERRTREE